MTLSIETIREIATEYGIPVEYRIDVLIDYVRDREKMAVTDSMDEQTMDEHTMHGLRNHIEVVNLRMAIREQAGTHWRLDFEPYLADPPALMNVFKMQSARTSDYDFHSFTQMVDGVAMVAIRLPQSRTDDPYADGVPSILLATTEQPSAFETWFRAEGSRIVAFNSRNLMNGYYRSVVRDMTGRVGIKLRHHTLTLKDMSQDQIIHNTRKGKKGAPLLDDRVLLSCAIGFSFEPYLWFENEADAVSFRMGSKA